MQTADALVQILRAEGVEQSFCYPFSPIMDAMARAGVQPIVTRQERVAGNMADGVSRSTNGEKLGVVTVQALAGSENAFAGIAHAHTDSTPVLFLPGHPGTRFVGTDPTFDSALNYRGVTKWSQTLLVADQPEGADAPRLHGAALGPPAPRHARTAGGRLPRANTMARSTGRRCRACVSAPTGGPWRKPPTAFWRPRRR